MQDQNVCSYLDSLESVANAELDQNAQNLVSAEAKNQAQLIAHLAEIGRRKLHLDLGYGSLFSYCLDRLGLCEGSIYLRLQVAKVMREFPGVLALLSQGRFNLTALGKLSPVLTHDNYEQVFRDCEGKKKAVIEEYVARIKPRAEVKAAIRRKRKQQLVLVPEDAATLVPSSEPNREPSEFSLARERADLKPVNSERYNFRFAASKELKDKIERLAEVIGVMGVAEHLEEILDHAVEIALDKTDPMRIEQRREKARQTRAQGKAVKPQADRAATPQRSRYIPQYIKAQALKAAGYRCQYESSKGVGCLVRADLEFDHIISFAKGGTNSEGNIAVLCAGHNLRKAERDFGPALIAGKIKQAQKSAKAGHMTETRRAKDSKDMRGLSVLSYYLL